MKQSLQLKLGQHLTMTPQLQQAIRLLQLSTIELQTEIQEALESGAALALLISDLEKKELYKLEGSPSYVLNSGRQKLYGNIGYKVIEANVKELFERDDKQASWC